MFRLSWIQILTPRQVILITFCYFLQSLQLAVGIVTSSATVLLDFISTNSSVISVQSHHACSYNECIIQGHCMIPKRTVLLPAPVNSDTCFFYHNDLSVSINLHNALIGHC
jgi:hypothetical protein